MLALKEKIESSTDVLKGVLKPVIDAEGEIPWPPRDPQALTLMEKVSSVSHGLDYLIGRNFSYKFYTMFPFTSLYSKVGNNKTLFVS